MQEFYEFESFRLDRKNLSLYCEDQLISLTPKEFDVFLLLIENAGNIVEKDVLLNNIWNDTFVEEATLTRNVSWLRKKLAACTDAKIIETVPKRGYRFLPAVKLITQEIEKKSQNGAIGNVFSINNEALPFDSNGRLISEQSVKHIEVEEFLEISPSSEDHEISIVNGKIVEVPKNRKALLPFLNERQISIFLLVPAFLMLALAIFAVYRTFFTGIYTQAILVTKIVPLSGSPGREVTPSFSPDGKQLVYAWDGGIEGANLDIYVKLIGAGEPVRLTETANDELNPVFAPDGKSIAFIRNFADRNEIIMISALGGAERKLYEKASYASLSFSPDGKFLAYANLDISKNEAGIFSINLQTNEKTRITTPENQIVDHTPRFSPDGKTLAFIRHFSSFHREIFIVPIEGGEPRQITNDAVRIYGLAWNIDSEKLFFTSFRTTNRLNLWQVSINGGEPQMIPTGSKELQSLAVSPDGKTIAFAEETADENIWEINGKQSRPLIRSTRADHSPQFSPDGKQIVFASDRTGNYEIWIADADGKNQRQLTDSENSKGSPRFSPDGKNIVYDAQVADKSDIYIVSANGGAPKKLTNAGKSNFLPAWSADGKTVFFVSNRANDNQIWKMLAEGGEAVQISKQGAFEIFALADGKTIIYSKGSGKAGLWSVGINGEDEKPIPELTEVGAWRSWSVDSTGVYFTSFSTQPPFLIKFFDFATRQTKEITTVEKSPLLYYSNLSVAADGKKILYARQDQSASTILFAELEK